ncbi:MAG TPA: phage portal protein [Terriglobales bacterium]|nr:phage portal protein [Terriglobales bacterium]
MALNGKDIDPGLVARVSGQSYASSSNPAANWFAPLQPQQVVAPKGSPARAFDYLTGINLVINPRHDEVVTYEHMRYVAENCPLVTLAIETRKDQITKQKWDVRLINDGSSTAEQVKAKAKTDPRIKNVKALLKKPDKELSWDGWLHKLLNEVLVTDSPAIQMRKTLGGDPYSLMIMDGTTITRKIALDGTTPLPPETAYQQIIKGVPYADFTTDELVFRPRNPRAHKLYGFSPVEQIIFMANIIMRRDLMKLNTYTEGNLPPALASVEDDWSADQIENFQQKFDAINQGNLAATRRLQFIPKINALHMLKQDVLKDDADEWFARIVMFAFSLPPTALTKVMNRASAEQAAESAEDEGLVPLMNWVGDLINELIQKFFGFDDIEFVWVPEKVVDPKAQSEIHKTYLDEGILTRNQILAQLGYDPIGDDGDVRTVITPNGPVPLSEVVMSMEDKQEAGLMPTKPVSAVPPPAAPKTGEPDPETEPTPKDKQDTKKFRNVLAAHYNDILEDLNPELRDPVIVSKLLEIERNG